jgi:tetratricopeptide (TPR) repeat protein
MRLIVIVAVLAMAAAAFGQTKNTAAASPSQDVVAGAVRALESGECSAPLLARAKRAYSQAPAADKKRLAAEGIRCAMTLNATVDAAALVQMMNRDFPDDPEALYISTHTYSDLALRASQTLLFKHPDAYQVHQLNAEALETQGKWDEAAEEYRMVLKKNPELPGIHYRLGRLLLSKPGAETTAVREEAKREFESELRINPKNAGAEFVLAELARQAENNDEAVERFTRAIQDDRMFADAYLGLGRSLLAAGKPELAVTPLEQAVKLQPDNPATHFHLATAYRRSGRKEDADREALAHKAASDRAQARTDELKKAVSGQAVGDR